MGLDCEQFKGFCGVMLLVISSWYLCVIFCYMNLAGTEFLWKCDAHLQIFTAFKLQIALFNATRSAEILTMKGVLQKQALSKSWGLRRHLDIAQLSIIYHCYKR